MEAAASDYPGARVVGWDTSVQGPLIEDTDGECFAVSPKGNRVDRPRFDPEAE